ncbi:MAG: hypothetical protein ACQEQI_07235 [Bacillota bacterium]
MTKKLAVIGLGNPLRRDLGVALLLLDTLRERLTNYQIEFINGGESGYDLYQLLQQLNAVRIIILDVTAKDSQPGKLSYLTMSYGSDNVDRKLILITIGVSQTDWGRDLSSQLLRDYQRIAQEIEEVIKSAME